MRRKLRVTQLFLNIWMDSWLWTSPHTEPSLFNDESDLDSKMAEREALEREIEKLQSKKRIYFLINLLYIYVFFIELNVVKLNKLHVIAVR